MESKKECKEKFCILDEEGNIIHFKGRKGTGERFKNCIEYFMCNGYSEKKAKSICGMIVAKNMKNFTQYLEYPSEENKMENILKSYLEKLDAKSKRETVITNIPTGFYELDRLTTGFKNGMIYVIGGISGTGKSAFIQRAALLQAKQGYKPCIFSLDEPIDLIISKMVAMDSRVPLRKIETGFLTGEELRKIVEKIEKLSQLNISIENTTFFEDIEEKLNLYKPDIVYVDSMSYLSFKDKPVESRYDEIRKILIFLKKLH